MFFFATKFPIGKFHCLTSQKLGQGLGASLSPLGGSYQDLYSKYLATMLIVSPLSRVVPLSNGLDGLSMGLTNHLLDGMILQVYLGSHVNVEFVCAKISVNQDVLCPSRWTTYFWEPPPNHTGCVYYMYIIHVCVYKHIHIHVCWPEDS